jgi:hypothetical protein
MRCLTPWNRRVVIFTLTNPIGEPFWTAGQLRIAYPARIVSEIVLPCDDLPNIRRQNWHGSGIGGLTFMLRHGGPNASGMKQRGNPALPCSTLVSCSLFRRMHAHTKASQLLSTPSRISKHCRSGKSIPAVCTSNTLPCQGGRSACRLASTRASHPGQGLAPEQDNWARSRLS